MKWQVSKQWQQGFDTERFQVTILAGILQQNL
jgi:hypothetical protein